LSLLEKEVLILKVIKEDLEAQDAAGGVYGGVDAHTIFANVNRQTDKPLDIKELYVFLQRMKGKRLIDFGVEYFDPIPPLTHKVKKVKFYYPTKYGDKMYEAQLALSEIIKKEANRPAVQNFIQNVFGDSIKSKKGGNSDEKK
jgi:hypothetical protein